MPDPQIPVDPQASAAAAGDGQILPAGGTPTPTMPPPAMPQGGPAPNPIGDFVNANATKSFGDFLREKMGESDADVAARKAGGKSEAMHKLGLLGQILLGRNFQGEAGRDYTTTQDQVKTAIGELRNQQLATQAAATVNERDLARQDAARKADALAKILQQNADTKRQQAETEQQKVTALNTMREAQTDIAKRLAAGKISVEQADAENKAAQTKWLDLHKGLTGADAVTGMMATDSTPEAMQLANARREASKGLGKMVSTGATGGTTTGTDASGNPITTHSTQRQFATPGAAILGAMGLPNVTGVPAAPPAAPGPANAAQALGLPNAPTGPQGSPPAPPVAPPTPLLQKPAVPPPAADPLAGYAANPLLQLHTDTVFSKKTHEAQEASYLGYKNALRGQSAQRANLADAAMTGADVTFQGPIAGAPLSSGLRNLFSKVDEHEVGQKVLDFDAVFSKLKSNVGGRYNIPEIKGATAANGEKQAQTQNALMAHAYNELNTQAHMLDQAHVIDNAHISAPELNDAVADDIRDYMGKVSEIQKKAASLPPAQKALYLSTVQKPDLTPLDQFLAKSRQNKKLKSVIAPAGAGASDYSNADLMKLYKSGGPQ